MLKAMIRALRPTHWVKNLIISGPLFFSLNVLDGDRVLLTVLAIALFSALASSIYLVNDIAETNDIANLHPQRVEKMKETLKEWQNSCKDSAKGKDYQ